MKISLEVLQVLSAFQRDATSQEFDRVFGQLGPHFWKRFTRNFNLLDLFTSLDASSQAQLIYHLNRRGGNHD